MQRPPSTSSATPVIMDASSLQRKQAAEAMSSGVERRPSGMVARNLARSSGVSFPPRNVFSIGVSPATGLSAFTRIPNGASSMAIDRVAVITQPFEALYHVRLARGLTPAVEAMFRIAPRFADFIAGTKCFDVRKIERTFTA